MIKMAIAYILGLKYPGKQEQIVKQGADVKTNLPLKVVRNRKGLIISLFEVNTKDHIKLRRGDNSRYGKQEKVTF